MGIFRSFVKTFGAGARPKHRYRNWYRVPSHRNITFSVVLKSGTHNFASQGSCFHMFSFFCMRAFSDCKLSILKCRKGIYWFNSFKLITGLLPSSFFFTINILLRNWSFCGQTSSTAPLFKRFFTSNQNVCFSCIEKFFFLWFPFSKEWNSIFLDYLQNILIFRQFFLATQEVD